MINAPLTILFYNVERLLKEREMRRSKSSSTLPNSEEAEDDASDTYSQSGEQQYKLLVVANRLPVSAHKGPDGWHFEVRADHAIDILVR